MNARTMRPATAGRASFIGLIINLIFALSIALVAAFFGADVSAQTSTSPEASNEAACSTQSANTLLRVIQNSSPPLHQMEIVSRLQWLPLGRPAELLALVPWNDTRKFRILLTSPQSDSPLPAIIDSDWISTEPATKGATGTDFLQNQSAAPKTSIRFTPLWYGQVGHWQPARVYLVSCLDGNVPEFYGQLDVKLTDPVLCFVLASFFCVLAYASAAYFTYRLHEKQRHILDSTPRHGTNYATLLEHFNPVIMTADDNGLGSPAKMQILFFTLVIFGVVLYVWMSTHHLSDLSKSVLLLMGISGAGAALSKATDVAKMRLDFDNWAWLIERKWLPEGGPAEINRAEWKDIITESGEFNVYRFQMLTFSVLVGAALIFSATRLADFTIPEALLYLLGSSQVIYLGGKLAGTPSVGDLNEQIDRLQAKEVDLLHALYERKPGKDPAEEIGLPLTQSELLERVGKCWAEYEDEWNRTQKMFESALVREVSAVARRHRPPFLYIVHPNKARPLLIERFDKAVLKNELLLDRLPEEPTKCCQCRELRHLMQAFDKARKDYARHMETSEQMLKRFTLCEITADDEEQLLMSESEGTKQKMKEEEKAFEQIRDALDSVHHCIKRMNELNEEIETILNNRESAQVKTLIA